MAPWTTPPDRRGPAGGLTDFLQALRPCTLARATAELRVAGDRLEPARTLAGLGDALSELGEDSMADAMPGRARQLASDCGAAPPRGLTLPAAPPGLPVL